MSFLASKFQLVELIVPAGTVGTNTQIQFQDQPAVQAMSNKPVIIKAIETFSNSAVPVSPLSTNPVASPFAIQNTCITFNINSSEYLKKIPLACFNRVINDMPSMFMLLQFKGIEHLNWTETYVSIVTAPPPASLPYSYLFGVWYELVDESDA